MIYIGVGSNLSSSFGSPRETCKAALKALETKGCHIVRVSKWYKTEPVPVSDDPWYVNCAIEIDTKLEPAKLLETLHQVEAEFDRKRGKKNAPRTIDLDILAYNDVVMDGAINLPHCRMHKRLFVLKPLKDIAPNWHHPISGLSIDKLLSAVTDEQKIHLYDEKINNL
ncbi:MAG: 2-amino-4-hydroxy-6-hydroxymethyldihydropteridine diphosphokinase [Alphaproteobacteria bacterium]|nr:2-amino-4-hydroxy-6-hydroxymethyldihydropteridine diphosphokinase [Alphaproteobacteria bacterium]